MEGGNKSSAMRRYGRGGREGGEGGCGCERVHKFTRRECAKLRIFILAIRNAGIKTEWRCVLCACDIKLQVFWRQKLEQHVGGRGVGRVRIPLRKHPHTNYSDITKSGKIKSTT